MAAEYFMGVEVMLICQYHGVKIVKFYLYAGAIPWKLI